MTFGGSLTQCINFTKKGHNGVGKIREFHSEIVKMSYPSEIIWLAKNQSYITGQGRDLSQMSRCGIPEQLHTEAFENSGQGT